MREIRTRKIPNTDTFYVVFISTEEDHSSYSRNGTRNFSFTFKGNHYSENYFKVSVAYCTYYFSRKLWNRSIIISTWWLSGSLSNIVIRPSKTTRITTKWKFEFIFLSKSFSFFWFNPFSTNFPIMVKPGSWLSEFFRLKKVECKKIQYSKKVKHIKSHSKTHKKKSREVKFRKTNMNTKFCTTFFERNIFFARKQERACAQSLRTATLLNRRLCHRCFPVNFAKFPRALFLTEHLWWLLLSLTQDCDWIYVHIVVQP